MEKAFVEDEETERARIVDEGYEIAHKLNKLGVNIPSANVWVKGYRKRMSCSFNPIRSGILVAGWRRIEASDVSSDDLSKLVERMRRRLNKIESEMSKVLKAEPKFTMRLKMEGRSNEEILHELFYHKEMELTALFNDISTPRGTYARLGFRLKLKGRSQYDEFGVVLGERRSTIVLPSPMRTSSEWILTFLDNFDAIKWKYLELRSLLK